MYWYSKNTEQKFPLFFQNGFLSNKGAVWNNLWKISTDFPLYEIVIFFSVSNWEQKSLNQHQISVLGIHDSNIKQAKNRK